MSTENIRGYKLLNGAEVVANQTSETDKEYIVENAMFWDLFEVQPGTQKFDVRFDPLSLGAKLDDNATHPGINLSLPKSTVLFPYVLRPEIEERYQKMVSPIIRLS